MNAAIPFNNHGVEFLEAGNYVDALKMLQGSLKVVSQIITTGQVTADKSIEMANSNLQKRPVALAGSSASKREASFFLYTKGVHIFPEQRINKSLIASAAMFNMALAHHMRSFESPSIRTQSLQKALKLYAMVFDTYSEEESKDAINDARAHIILASLNNIGQIQHEFGEYNKSRRYLDELYRLATSLPDSTYEEFTKDRTEFLLNASLLKSPSRAAAA